MKIKAIKIVCFVLIFCVLLYSVSRVLRFKYHGGIKPVDVFYQQPKKSIDVLFIGSSRVYCDIIPYVLFNDYGISSFNLTSDYQPLWHSYFFIKEALKTQKPKLIIIEVFTTEIYNDYATDAEIIKFAYGLKWSLNKINALKISSPKNRWNEFINPFYQYHNRYSSLISDDFFRNNIDYKSYKGYHLINWTKKFQRPYVNNVTNYVKLHNKTEEYYRKTIELVKNNDIPLILTISPYPAFNENRQKIFNTAKKIADEYNVPFINFNFNYDDYNLDFNTDFADNSHLNYKGAIKLTRYLGKYLKENYDLPDRRGDPKYYSWEMNAKYEYKKTYNFELKQYSNLNEYLKRIKDADDYVIGITMLGNYQNNDAVVQSIASNFNINDIYLQNASYAIDNNKLIYSSSGSNKYLFYDEIGSYDDLVIDSGQKLSINRGNYIRTQNGINIVIYDKFTEEIVDNIYLEYQGNSINPAIKR
ncbi:SGNH/GDSL hydrolase family protein [Brachyspira intermedia]|uniref:SGNH/GDSL hydrolase family protein n=1 Tax=Brachyspira intermedia TaxID=84377 RepID=UPI00300789E1